MRTPIVIALAVLALVALPLGLPVHLSYVYSGSMEPALSVDDAYLVVPALSVTEGDIIVFHSETRAEFITHRVVAVTDDGYRTKGDANLQSDQANGLQPVTDDQLVGQVLTVGGAPLVVPRGGEYLRLAVENRRVTLLAVLALGVLAGRSRVTPHLQREQAVLNSTFVVLVIVLAAVVVLGAPSYDTNYVVTTGEADGYRLTVGEPATRTVELVGGTPWYIHRGVTVEGATVDSITQRDDQLSVRIHLAARETTGALTVRTTVYHYPGLLPGPVIDTLHDLHPGLAGVASTATLLTPVYVLYLLARDPRTPARSIPRRGWLGELP